VSHLHLAFDIIISQLIEPSEYGFSRTLSPPRRAFRDFFYQEFAAGKNVVVNVTRAMDEEHILAFKLAADS
jgi:hypothetical protein